MANPRITLRTLRDLKSAGRKFAMLTAYDYPTARAADAAGVHSLLVGDSLGCVLLGHENTRRTPLALMVTLAEAVRRGAPGAYLVGDLPFEAMASDETIIRAARAFRDDAGCDAVKLEAEGRHAGVIRRLASAGFEVIAHLGLRPQGVLTPDGYRAQARDERTIAALVDEAREMVAAGASLILLEAVPPAASAAVVAAVAAPVIGCGAGPACDGHVVVTHDLLGFGAERPPRFVPVYADLRTLHVEAMRRWVDEIASGRYPSPSHAYALRAPSATPAP